MWRSARETGEKRENKDRRTSGREGKRLRKRVRVRDRKNEEMEFQMERFVSFRMMELAKRQDPRGALKVGWATKAWGEMNELKTKTIVEARWESGSTKWGVSQTYGMRNSRSQKRKEEKRTQIQSIQNRKRWNRLEMVDALHTIITQVGEKGISKGDCVDKK